MQQRKLLVTGGAGFIGANFVHYWRREYPGDQITVLDALTYAGNRASLPATESNEFKFVHGDIRDQRLVETLLRERQIDTIVHFAAESHVDRSIEGPDIFIDTNVIGTHSLLKAARRVWIDERKLDKHRFHHVSTDEVYGSLNMNDPPFTESTPYAPNSPYSASKAASDHLVRAYTHTYGLTTTTTNCSNNYGPYQFPEKLIPLMLLNALRGKPLPVYGDGTNVRDWLYVDDHCRGIDLVLRRGEVGETYNIGGNNERRNIDLVKGLCDKIDEAFGADKSLKHRYPDCPCARGVSSHSLISFVKDRPGHDFRYAIDARKAKDKVGYVPRETLESGIARTLEWYLAEEAWWQSVLNGSYADWVRCHYGSSSPDIGACR